MARIHTMTSMELDDEEKLDAAMPLPMPDKPEFPYGLKICLTEAEFKKLDLDMSEAKFGGIFHGHFLARITSVSTSESPNGPCCRVEAQIEDLEIESEDEENERDGR
jgi:hypothetical protein